MTDLSNLSDHLRDLENSLHWVSLILQVGELPQERLREALIYDAFGGRVTLSILQTCRRIRLTVAISKVCVPYVANVEMIRRFSYQANCRVSGHLAFGNGVMNGVH